VSRLYHLYLVECADGTLYCGISTDVGRRVEEHNGGRRGAKYARSRRPVRLLVSWSVCCLSCSLRTERKVKGLSRQKKLRLIESPELFADLMIRCSATE